MARLGCQLSQPARVDYFTYDWRPRIDWNNDDIDDWWCIAFQPSSPFHIPSVNGTCGRPQQVFDCSLVKGNNPLNYPSTLHFEVFPEDDPGWRCILPPAISQPQAADASDLAAVCKSPALAAVRHQPSKLADGYRSVPLSVCLDIGGTHPHVSNLMPMDAYYLIFLAVIVDSVMLLLWLHERVIVKAMSGEPVSPNLHKVWGGVGGVSLLAALILPLPGVIQPGVVSAPSWPGTPVTALVCLTLAYFFLCMSLAHRYSRVRYVARCFVKLHGFMSRVKGGRGLWISHTIDSDRALCFYLVEWYHSRWNAFRRVVLYVIICGGMFIIIFFVIPALTATDPEAAKPLDFVGAQGLKFLLLGISLFHSLHAPNLPSTIASSCSGATSSSTRIRTCLPSASRLHRSCPALPA